MKGLKTIAIGAGIVISFIVVSMLLQRFAGMHRSETFLYGGALFLVIYGVYKYIVDGGVTKSSYLRSGLLEGTEKRYHSQRGSSDILSSAEKNLKSLEGVFLFIGAVGVILILCGIFLLP